MNSEAIVENANRRAERPALTNDVRAMLPEFDLIRAATLAPSPDNNQPWRFRFDEGKLLVYEDHARRLPSDVCSMFSLLGFGAAIENVAVAATQHGLAAEVTCLKREEICDSSDHGQPSGSCFDTPVAEVGFAPGATPDRLAAMLEVRCTNRYPFSRKPLPDESLNQMAAAATRFHGCDVSWLTDRATIRQLSKLVAVADRVRFERAEFHAELFRQLRFTPAEAARSCDGLDLRTLGLPAGGGLMLRALQSWPAVRALNCIGLSRMLTLPSAALVRKSGALGVLTVAAPTSAAFLAAGRALQRLWLTASALNLSLHPLGSLPIFVGHHELLASRCLDRGHACLAAGLAQDIRALLPAIGGMTLVMIFRVGISSMTPVRSLRRSPEQVWERLFASPSLKANEAQP